MAQDSLLISDDIKQYIGKHSAELMMLAYQSMDVMSHVTQLPDVKNEITLTSLAVDSIVRPYNETFQPKDNAIEFKPNTIGVKVGKADLRIEPEKYRQTYLAQFTPGSGVKRTPEDLPFVAYIMEAVFAAFGQDLNNVTAWNGVYDPNGDSAIDVADGYGTILKEYIQDGKVEPIGTGALNADNALQQLKNIYRNIPEKYRTRKANLVAYMSQDSYEAYIDNLDKLAVNVGRGDDIPNTRYLRGTDGLLTLQPASWMHGSQRVMITLKENILLPYDGLSQDLAKANIVSDVWSFKLGIAAALGFNFRYKGLIWCNEAE